MVPRELISKKKIILFDFDGVIADSFLPAFEVNKMMCPHLTETLYRQRFGGNINDSLKIEDGHTDACRHDIDFFAEYVPRMNNVELIPGIEAVIPRLSELYSFVIISSSLTRTIKEFLEKHKLSHYFSDIMGNDTHTSKAEKIKMVFSKYDTSPENCIMITDTLGDMREAEQVAVRAIGVVWGFQDSNLLLQGKPFRIVEKPADLYTAVTDYFESYRLL